MIKLDDVSAVREALEQEWGYQTTNDQITAKFCRVCQAMVPWYANELGGEDRSVLDHKDYHLALARILSGLSAWHTPIG